MELKNRYRALFMMGTVLCATGLLLTFSTRFLGLDVLLIGTALFGIGSVFFVLWWRLYERVRPLIESSLSLPTEEEMVLTLRQSGLIAQHETNCAAKREIKKFRREQRIIKWMKYTGRIFRGHYAD